MLIDFKKMNNLDYHKKQLKYNMTALLAEIKKAYPDEVNPNLNDPKFKAIIESMPFNPMIAGGIAKELGLTDQVMTLDLWEDFCNGYAPAAKIPADSPLQDLVIDTPRGKMVQFTKAASQINSKGDYVLEPATNTKQKRLGVEFIFGLAGNVSSAVARLATEDPSVENKVKDMFNRVMKEHVLPAMLEDALIRTGKDGVDLHYVKEILWVNFMHSENRSELPFYHIHGDLLNVALGYDDKLYSLNTDQVVQNKDHYNAIFQAAMKHMMEQELGFVFKPVYLDDDLNNEFLADHEKNICAYDLTDDFVPQNVQDFAGARQKEIEDAVKKKGKPMSFLEMEHARLETRDEKTDLSPSELRAQWKVQYDQLGFTADHVKKAMRFNQVMPNTAKLDDEQLLTNYQRKVNAQAVRNGQSTKFNYQVPAGLYKQGNLPAAKRRSVQMVETTYESDAAADERLIQGFIRKHREVSFTEHQFKAHMVKQLLETHDKEGAFRKAEQLFNDNCLHMMDKTKLDYFKEFMENKAMEPFERQQKMIQWSKNMQFTTKGIRDMEMRIFDTLNARKDESHLSYSEQEVSEFIISWEDMKSTQFGKPVKMAKGQRDAVIAAICSKGGIVNIAGRAGSGKSFLLECVKDFYETKGVTMMGTSTSAAATIELEKSTNMKAGQSFNTAKLLQLLKTDKKKITKDTVIVIDEAGMMDLEPMHDLVMHANKVGARLVLSGEVQQLQNVGLGSVLRTLSDEFGFTPVTEINRQSDSWQREMVNDFASGRSAKAVRSLYDHGRVIITKTEDERIAAAVQAYMTATHMEEKTVKVAGPNGFVSKTEKVEVATSFEQKVMIAATNFEVERLNNEVRAALKKEGKLPEVDQATITCADKVERGFSEGDRVIFTKSSKSSDADPLEVANSQTGTVIGFKMDKLTKKPIALQIRLDTGKEVFMDCKKKKPAIRSAYCITTHKSQGQTKMSAMYVPSQNSNSLHQAYVACSRHKKNVTMFLSDQMADKLAEKAEDKEPTARMVEVARLVAKSRGVELPLEVTQSFGEARAFLNENYEKMAEVGIVQHRVDDFTNIISAMAKESYKKSTLDYQLLDGEHVNAYKEAKQLRKDLAAGIAEPVMKAKAVKKEEEFIPEHARKSKPIMLNQLPTIKPVVPESAAPALAAKKTKAKKKELGLTR
ncbi:nucleoside-triphosphatase THEP1 [Massilia sp. UYP11]|uniref:AAA family ATPase n=1 Tax=Massilia sp. UYP11 TaxID=1756385 RepID=UPI003D20F02C